MRIPFVLIQHVVLLKRDRELAIFIKMKDVFTNSCLFDYNETSAAKAFKVSRTVTRKYIKRFLKNGWCRMHHNNIVFNDLIAVAKAEGILPDNPGYDGVWKRKKTVFFELGENVSQTINELRLWIIRKKNQDFEKTKRLSLDCKYSNPKSKKNIEILLKKKKLLAFLGLTDRSFSNVEEKYLIGLKKISKHINMSISSAYRVMRGGEEMGRIKYIHGPIEFLGGYIEGDLRLAKPGYFITKGILCRRHVNQYIF